MLWDPIYTGSVLTFFIAVIVTYIYTTSRDMFRQVSEAELRIIIPIMSLSAILFALLATFTISNLWDRYQDIRQMLVRQINQLRFLYRAIKLMPETEDIQRDIKLYADSLATTQLKALARQKHSKYTEFLYAQLVKDVLMYTEEKKPTNQFVIFSNLYTGESGEQLVTSEINRALYFVILLTAILTLGAFWFLNIEDHQVQFLVDLFVIIIIGLVLYLIHELMNPFESDLLQNTFRCIYNDFLEELDRDLPDVSV